MTLEAGRKLGPYEIIEPIGAGGMGEVYRARDTRLDRDVAIKVLPSHLSENPEVRQRFEREARAASSLNHPHICTLHDIGSQDGVDFLVMEYLEGETMADRLEKGAIPTEELMGYAIQMADALDKAHRQGLIHRDLKPGNIMLTKSGAKLLDFGLAKSSGIAPGTSDASITPTMSRNLTAEGAIVGTFQYMSPELLEGKDADARSDIFAFGAVLYEMTTGKKAFEGKSQAGVIGAILERQPRPITRSQPMAPPALDRLVKTCLAKNPDDRRQTIHDVLLELKWIQEAGSQAGVPAPVAARRKTRERVAWAAAIVLAAVSILFGVGYFRETMQIRHPVRSFILPAEKSNFRFTGDGGPPEISPDGLHLTFLATDPQGIDRLWIRSLDELVPRPLPGTEGATFPFWSPDSRFVGFFAERKLKKIDVSGGPALTLCEAWEGRGGTWNRDGIILFSPHWREPIHRVADSGGEPEPISELDTERLETTHRWPRFLPDGQHYIYMAGTHTGGVKSEANAIYVSELGSKERQLLVHARSNPVYSDGYLLFLREGTLMAQSFDPDRLEMTGTAVPVAENITYSTAYFRAVYSVSRNGVLAYQAGGGSGAQSKLLWYDRDGKPLDSLENERNYANPRWSPDGSRIAVALEDPADLWIYEVSRKVLTRFTFDPAEDFSPVWSPDGKEIVFSSWRQGFGDLYRKVTSGTGSDELLLTTEELKVATDWSGDGRFLLFQSLGRKSGWDLWAYSLEEEKVTPVLQTENNESEGYFSPDGKWFAYRSDESGKREIYVQPFPPAGGKWQVSINGGRFPVWREDGKEIFYFAPDGSVMAVEVEAGDGFRVGIPRPLFKTRWKLGGGPQFDILPDGQRFLINQPLHEETSDPIILVQNWTEEFEN